MSRQSRHFYEFGSFRLEPEERRLLDEGGPVELTPKVFDTLLVLMENSGRLVQKEQLLNKVWPDTTVEEGNLSLAIHALRKALANGHPGVHYIETVPRHGYRFVAPVKEHWDEDKTTSVGPETPVRWFKPKAKPSRLIVAGAIAGIGLVLIALAIATATRRLAPRDAAAGKQTPQVVQTLAVLPFESLNSRHSDEFLGVGIADALITRLSESREMNIRPLESVRRYSVGGIDPLRAGRELAVGAVLHGNIQQHAGKIRVTMQLLNVANGAPLWADQVDSRFDDMFAVEDSIAADVARTLLPKVIRQARSSHPQTANAEAYEAYMKGRFFWSKRTAKSLSTAVQFFQQAIAKDPRYAEAYAGMADAYALLGFYDFLSPAESYPKAKQAALKAVALDDGLAEAHASLLSIETDYDWDWASAEREFRRAIELNPNYATAYQWHAYVQLATGHVEGAIADLDRAMQLDPLSPGINISSAWPYYLGRRYESSLKQCAKTLELYPDFVVARQVLAMDYTQRGEYSEAAAELRKVQAMDPQNPMTQPLFAHLYAVSGRRDQAEQALEHVFASRGDFKIPSYYVAAVYAALGQKDDAFRWLNEAHAERSNWLIYLRLDPRFDRLRTDPRFGSLLKQIGLSS